MASGTYSLEPHEVPKIRTKYRRIVTKWPVPESLPVLEELRRYEPVSMSGQPPVVWARAEGFQVYDRWGNKWLDFSSGVLVANAGHAAREIRKAIIGQVEQGLLHNYCFPSEIRGRLAKRLVELAPRELDKCFLLTTGAETTENAIKLARTYGQTVGGKKKIGIISFENAFHGRTLGAQMAGGIPKLKSWIVNIDPDFHTVPFPDGFRCRDTSFNLFLRSLDEKGIKPETIAAVITETFQGGGASFAPRQYIRDLARWCRDHNILLIFDEIQAAFGRTGKMWGFEHYGVVPDLICLGKGISSSLPISAVLGRSDVMNIYKPGEMTSTHTGNPVCCAAALANIEVIQKRKLILHAAEVGKVLHRELRKLQKKFPQTIGAVHGKGLVAGLHIVKQGSIEPDAGTAFRIVENSVKRGLLFFSPVGYGGATIKVCPPLVITEAAVKEGISTLAEAIEESLAA